MKYVETFLKWCFDIAGVSLVFLMAITVVDIAARNMGLFALRGIVELSTMAVVLIGLLALPYSFKLGDHIVVDLATMRLSPRTNARIDGGLLIITGFILAFVAWLMWGATTKSYRANDLSLDLELPMVVFWIPASIGMTLAPIGCLLAGLAKFRDPPGKSNEEPETEHPGKP